ncbi:hypothetical protein WUBG_11855, partial [Wuchereria bancrofti]
VPIFLFTTEFLSGWSLLMNSVERLFVVALPIYYYTHNTRITYSIIVAHYGITATAASIRVFNTLLRSATITVLFRFNDECCSYDYCGCHPEK